MQALLSCTPFLAVSCSNLYWSASLYPLLKTFMHFKYNHLFSTYSKASLILDFQFTSVPLSPLIRLGLQCLVLLNSLLTPFIDIFVKTTVSLSDMPCKGSGLTSILNNLLNLSGDFPNLRVCFLKDCSMHSWKVMGYICGHFPPLSWIVFSQLCGRRLWGNHN